MLKSEDERTGDRLQVSPAGRTKQVIAWFGQASADTQCSWSESPAVAVAVAASFELAGARTLTLLIFQWLRSHSDMPVFPGCLLSNASLSFILADLTAVLCCTPSHSVAHQYASLPQSSWRSARARAVML